MRNKKTPRRVSKSWFEVATIDRIGVYVLFEILIMFGMILAYGQTFATYQRFQHNQLGFKRKMLIPT